VDYSQATRINPKSSKVWYDQGRVLLDLGRNSEAIASYDHAIQLNNAWSIDSLATVYVDRGVVYGKQGNKQSALQDYSQAIRINPNFSLAWYDQGAVLAELGRYSEAIASYNRAIQLNNRWGTSSLTNAYLKRGGAYYKQGNKQAALQDFSQAIHTNPQSSLAWYVQGHALTDLGRYSEAIASYDRAIQLNKDWGKSSLANAYLDQGVTHEKQGNKQAALQDYNQAVRLNPNSSLAWYNQGAVLAELGRNSEAITSFDHAIQVNNNWGSRSLAYAFFYRGRIRDKQGNKKAAIADFNQAITIAPDNATGYQLRGLSYHSQGDYRNAIAAYEKVITQDPKLIDPVNNIGLIKYEQGDFEGAIRQFQAAIVIDNKRAEPQLAQAVALYTKGDQERGLAMAEAALKLDKNFANIEILKRNLWGAHLIADTRKLLQNPRIQAILSHGK
jgi:tetratricopeptide (TPR) repeat protein